MQVELMIFNPKTFSHESTQVVEDKCPGITNLDQHYIVRAVYAYPALNQVRIYADPKPEPEIETPTDEPSPTKVAYLLEVEEAAHEEDPLLVENRNRIEQLTRRICGQWEEN